MFKHILINLFTTFVFSTLIAIVALRIDFHFTETFVRARLDITPKGLPELLIAINAVVFIASLPAVALASIKIRRRKVLSIFCYYIGPISLLAYLSYLAVVHGDVYSWILFAGPVVIFLIIHTYFFFKLPRTGKQTTTFSHMKDLP